MPKPPAKRTSEPSVSRLNESARQALAKRRCDEAEAALRRRVRMIRTTIESCYGEEGLLAIPFRSADAGSIDGLLDQTGSMEKSLQKFNLPRLVGNAGSSAPSIMPPPGALADSLKSRAVALREAYAAYSLERQERRAV